MKTFLLIPSSNSAPRRQDFANRHPLLLAAADAPYPSVADERVLDMSQSENSRQYVRYRLAMLSASFGDTRLRGAGLCSEVKGLLHRECGEVHIVLGAVLNVSAIVLRNFCGCECVVEDVSMNGVVVSPVVGEGLKQGTATRARTAEDHWKRKSDYVDIHECGYPQSISPGFTQPSNPVKMSRTGGWRSRFTMSMNLSGLSSEASVAWYVAPAPNPTTLKFSNKTPSSLVLMSDCSSLR